MLAIDLFLQTWPTEPVPVTGRDLALGVIALVGCAAWIVFAIWLDVRRERRLGWLGQRRR